MQDFLQKGSYILVFVCNPGKDLRHLIREGANDELILDVISAIWKKRTDRYSELRTSETVILPKVEMSYIGG